MTVNYLLNLRNTDMWKKQHGRFGAEGVFEDELLKEAKQEEYSEKKASERLQEESIEAYDEQMSRQGDIVYPGLKGNIAGNKR